MKKILKILLPKQAIKLYYRLINITRNEFYKGDNVFCLICSSNFKKFRPYGVVKRDNALCPDCGSLERHRLLWSYFGDKLNVFKQINRISVLHFAPEHFFYNSFDSSKNIDYVHCDLVPDKYKFKGVSEVIKVDIINIPFPENTFDLILCNHVLEHIPNDEYAMKELYRVLKKNGVAILQVPIDIELNNTYEDWQITKPEERELAFGQKDHVRIYGLDYVNRLEKSGFKVEINEYVKQFSSEDSYKYGFSNSESIYHCTKQ